jgi:hypothetical protein
MPVGAGNARWRLAHAALLAAALTGCAQGAGGTEEGDGKRVSASGTATHTGVEVAERGGTIGPSGSACQLPVTFDIAEEWTAESVDAGAASAKTSGGGEDDLGGEVADALLHQGPVTAACEVDAKPAGHIGFLRVWTGAPGDDDARAVLKAFVAAEGGTSKAKYHDFTTGDLKGVEVEYLFTSKLLDETKPERALAVTTTNGPVVVHLGGLDSGEHRAMLPAYELAKRTLRTA